MVCACMCVCVSVCGFFGSVVLAGCLPRVYNNVCMCVRGEGVVVHLCVCMCVCAFASA